VRDDIRRKRAGGNMRGRANRRAGAGDDVATLIAGADDEAEFLGGGDRDHVTAGERRAKQPDARRVDPIDRAGTGERGTKVYFVKQLEIHQDADEAPARLDAITWRDAVPTGSITSPNGRKAAAERRRGITISSSSMLASIPADAV